MTESAEYQPRRVDSPVLAHLRELVAALRERLASCRSLREHPPVEAVHRLRTGARRTEATLEMLARMAGKHGLGEAAEEARQSWLRQLKKVRRAAGKVRDLDVHRELLAENFLLQQNEQSRSRHHEGRNISADDALARHARALDVWLKQRRGIEADALCATLDRHAERLLEAEQQFMSAMSQRRTGTSHVRRPVARLALEDYLRLVSAMPLLDNKNLHDFRKGAKKARYVTEAAKNDPAAKAIAKAIKRVQDAIGEWHDWDVLAGESRDALGQNGETLRSALETKAEQAYERAIRMTIATNRRLVNEWRAATPGRRRRPMPGNTM